MIDEDTCPDFNNYLRQSPFLFDILPKCIKLSSMTRETRTRILIILALIAGYIIVAVLRSGTAW